MREQIAVRVGLSLLQADEERALHHGQTITIGPVHGAFLDERYVPVSVAIDSIDDVTGLLGREGMAWEIAFGARVGLKHGLLLTRPA